MPRVSVIIPTYNRSQKVLRAVKSVLAQSYTNFELLVVDDGSTDGTADVLSAIDDLRFRFLQLGSNKGASAARNHGLRSSSASYVSFLDSDDEWFYDKLAKQVAFLDSHPDIALVYSAAMYVYDSGASEIARPAHRGSVWRDLLVRNVLVGSTSSVMLRRELLEQVGGFDESLPSYQDTDLWLRVCAVCQADYVTDVLVCIHLHGEANRISNNALSRLSGAESFVQKHEQAIAAAGLTHVVKRELAWSYQKKQWDLARARQLYLEAIECKPHDLRTYVMMASTLLPRGVFRAMIELNDMRRRRKMVVRRESDSTSGT